MNYLNKYTEFLTENNNNTLAIYYSIKFRATLNRLRDSNSLNTRKVALVLLETEDRENKQDKYSLIDITDSNDKISLIQVGRIDKYFPNFTEDDIEEIIEPDSELWTNSRIEFKLGKWVKRIYEIVNKTTIDNSVLEEFVNSYKADYDKNDNRILEVEGEDIRKYYLEYNYSKNVGQLGNSCMRYESCQSYFDIYVYNPEVCKLLIMLDEDGKLKGRAILWTLDDGSKYVDRIYTSYDSDKLLFTIYANENGYSSYPISTRINVELKEYEFDEYPYMDTLTSLNLNSGELTSAYVDSEEWVILQQTDGRHSQNAGVYSEYLDIMISDDDAVWCENINSYAPRDNSFWMAHRDEYGYETMDDKIVWSYYYDDYFYKDECVYNKYKDEYYYKPESDSRFVTITIDDEIEYFPNNDEDITIDENGNYHYTPSED